MEQHIGELIAHYGYFGIVIALAGGIVGLPIPDEFLLTFVGYNVSKGVMSGTAAFLSWDGWCDVRDHVKLHIRFKTWAPCFKEIWAEN